MSEWLRNDESEVLAMNKEDLSYSIWVYISCYKIFYSTVVYVPT